MTTSTTDFLAEYEAGIRRRHDKLAAACTVLLAALRRTRAAMVQIAYDGEDDSGQITDINATSARNKQVTLPGSVVLDLDDRPCRYERLEDALEAFAWSLLRVHHDGFENDDGGFGTIDIDVAKGTVLLDHNDRVQDVYNTKTEA